MLVTKRNANQSQSEISPQKGQRGRHQKSLANGKQAWEEGSSPTLLDGMWIATAPPIVNRMEGSSENLEREPAYDPAIPLLGIYLENTKTFNSKRHMDHPSNHDAHSSIIYSSRDIDTTQASINLQ